MCFLWNCNHAKCNLTHVLSGFFRNGKVHHGMLINLMLFKWFWVHLYGKCFKIINKRQVLYGFGHCILAFAEIRPAGDGLAPNNPPSRIYSRDLESWPTGPRPNNHPFLFGTQVSQCNGPPTMCKRINIKLFIQFWPDSY